MQPKNKTVKARQETITELRRQIHADVILCIQKYQDKLNVPDTVIIDVLHDTALHVMYDIGFRDAASSLDKEINQK